MSTPQHKLANALSSNALVHRDIVEREKKLAKVEIGVMHARAK